MYFFVQLSHVYEIFFGDARIVRVILEEYVSSDWVCEMWMDIHISRDYLYTVHEFEVWR